ncbi:ABC transporter ATP-binding protein [Actinoalloteichus hymeniacidonis]|uniref:ABC-type multidrug transport system, ATPase and permease component n=1 Tax=Actinoalloteichus hymeniacidonis TaxID=340345 RepID=A0AAC9HSK4_9PSEU|nr:ABC transporter ATP-binding protein [Actinoalloteichus hymeniacidonis]AOS63710.1 ABC-type multidrug transport system, ATPase and permease component [Actinoalloteichus hymeniacidonis]MBB5908237.1 ATP-binding cassette subfamily B protein [Actinoalloteichus hymeniacidonis]
MTRHPLFRLVRPVRGLLLAALVAQALASAAVVVPLAALVQFGGAWITGSTGGAGMPIAIAVVSAIAGVLFASLASWLSHLADSAVQLDVQRRLITAFSRQPLSSFTKEGTGRLKKVVHDDVGAIHYLVAHTVLDVTSVVITPVTGLVVLFGIDWRFAILALLPLVAGTTLFLHAMRGSGANFAVYAKAQGDINSAIVEYVHGVPVIKAFGRARGAQEAFARSADRFHDFFRAWSSSTSAATTASWMVVAPAVTLTAFAGVAALAIMAGWASASSVLALALIGPAISAPIAVIGPRLQAIRTGAAAAQSITAVLDREPTLWGDGRVKPADNRLRFDQVTFGYSPDQPVLKGLTVEFVPGAMTALVGPSGAGKSTMAALIARFHDPQNGTISIGGVDVRQFTAESLYRTVSFVFQDVVLLSRSVRDYLTSGRPVDDETMHAAARAASVHDRVLATPLGYDSVIGKDVEFSGGEAQRLSIARALLLDTPIVVLDEPTAAADPETQAEIQAGVSALVRGRTVVIIAHHLTTITKADQILVLNDGVLVERGTHSELIAAEGGYRRMWDAQQPAKESH